MRRRPGWGIVPRVDPLVLDGLIALAFIAIAQTDVWAPWGDNGQKVTFEGPRWLSSAILLAGMVPFVWRRRAPLVTAGAFAAAVVLDVTLVSQTALFFGEFIPMLVATYSVAAYAPRGRAVLGVGMTGAAVLVVTLAVDELRTLSEVPFELVVVAAVWSVGRVVHRQRTRADALSEHADALERRRDHEARAAVGLERRRIARELHDVIAHSVSLMGVQAAAAEQVLALDPERAREPLRAIQDTARDAIDELRRLLGVLRDSDDAATLVPQPGLDALGALVEQMRGAGLPVELRVEGSAAKLSPGVELSAYRVIQEALTNALKHAGAAPTTVTVRHGADALELEIVDAGRRNGHSDGTGHGLVGMHERVALYGGTLSSAHRREGGYAVRASLPTQPGRA
jgi:signal transduction histidine kinase